MIIVLCKYSFSSKIYRAPPSEFSDQALRPFPGRDKTAGTDRALGIAPGGITVPRARRIDIFLFTHTATIL